MSKERNAAASPLVQVFVTDVMPNWQSPWQKQAQMSGSGSAFVVAGRLIVTSAHVLTRYSTTIKVRRHGMPDKYTARVVRFDGQRDLALLTVDGDAFWEGVTPLELRDELPAMGDKVKAHGFPISGNGLSITQGNVSRIETPSYVYSGLQFPAIQIDAAINSGNSGGPVMDEKGLVIGVAMQGNPNAQNIGFITPVMLVKHVLDHKDSETADLPCNFQGLENKGLRDSLGLADDIKGCVATKIHYGAAIQAGDVITHLDGAPMDNEGYCKLRESERIVATFMFRKRCVKEVIRVGLFRKGKHATVNLRLARHVVGLPDVFSTLMPSYFVWAGLVFTPLTRNLINQREGRRKNVMPLEWIRIRDDDDDDRLQGHVVILSILADEINTGYRGMGFENRVVKTCDDVPIRDLATLVKIARDCKDRFATIRINDSAHTIVIDRKEAQKAEARILDTHHIPAAVHIEPPLKTVAISTRSRIKMKR